MSYHHQQQKFLLVLPANPEKCTLKNTFIMKIEKKPGEILLLFNIHRNNKNILGLPFFLQPNENCILMDYKYNSSCTRVQSWVGGTLIHNWFRSTQLHMLHMKTCIKF